MFYFWCIFTHLIILITFPAHGFCRSIEIRSCHKIQIFQTFYILFYWSVHQCYIHICISTTAFNTESRLFQLYFGVLCPCVRSRAFFCNEPVFLIYVCTLLMQKYSELSQLKCFILFACLLQNKVTSMTFLTGKAVEDLCRIKQVNILTVDIEKLLSFLCAHTRDFSEQIVSISYGR